MFLCFERFTNSAQWRNMTARVAAEGVTWDFGFGPQALFGFGEPVIQDDACFYVDYFTTPLVTKTT